MAAGDLSVRPADADPMVPLPATVRRIVRETHDTITLHLEPPRPWRFAPGQFNMLYLFGVGEVPISLSGDPERPEVIVHTVRGVGTVTRPMIGLRRGAVVGVRGPYGSAWPLAAAEGQDLLFVAGGIGMAPLRAAIAATLARRSAYGRVVVLYGMRTPADLLYAHDLARWRTRGNVDVRIIVDRPQPGWGGDVGVVTTLISTARLDAAQTVAMLCGPEIMMRFAVRELDKRGIPARNVHLSLERNMKCAVGWCGHCQYGPTFVCRDGPVLCLETIAPFFGRREI
jgi:NAD(P)H-flavin reductase